MCLTLRASITERKGEWGSGVDLHRLLQLSSLTLAQAFRVSPIGAGDWQQS